MAKRHYASKKARMHEHMGMEKYERGPVKRKYDMLRHEPNKYNDEYRQDSDPVEAGLYNYDRQRASDVSEYRRYKEMYEAGIIHEDPRAVANLPQEVRYEAYPKAAGYLPEDLDDTLRGVDRQMGYDNRKKMEHFYPKKV